MPPKPRTPASGSSSAVSETSSTRSHPMESGSSAPRPGTPSSKGEGTVFYRSIFESANMFIEEGFLQSHPQLHPDLQMILLPTACLPYDLRAQYPQLMKVEDEYFYEQKPEYLHSRQVEAINYLFVTRPDEMHFGSVDGGTESMWEICTKFNLFLPLFDPNSEMRVLSKNISLKFPKSLGTWAQYLTNPKPDLCFGSKLNLKRFKSPLCSGVIPSIFSLDNERVQSLFSVQEFAEISCGVVDLQFVFPTFTVERKSDNGSYYFAQNQLLGTLRCVVEAQLIAKRRVNKDLPVLALGLVNVGNRVELWACWPVQNMNENAFYAWHISDYHLFNLRSCVEFSSMAIRINQWINAYQNILHESIVKNAITMNINDLKSDDADDVGTFNVLRYLNGIE